MLIRCENCGKLFDFDNCGGLCPDCGHFHSAPPVTHSFDAQPNFQASAPSGRVVGSAKSPSDERPPQRILAIILAVLWGVLLLGGFGLYSMKKNRWEKSGKLADLQVQTVSAQNITLHGQKYAFGPYQKMTSHSAGLPEGHVLVRVQIDRKEPDEWVREREDSCFLQVDSPRGTTFFAPLDSYSIERVYPELMDTFMDTYSLHSTEAAVGYMYFAVPSDFTSLSIYLEEATRMKYKSPRKVVSLLHCSLEQADFEPEAQASSDKGTQAANSAPANSLPDNLSSLTDVEVNLDA